MTDWKPVATGIRISDELRTYLQQFNGLYPNIDRWALKVSNELGGPRRSAFLLRHAGQVCGASIIKHGEGSKLCHLSVSEPIRGLGAAEFLMRRSLSAILSRQPRRVSLTVGEDTYSNIGGFLAMYGFKPHTWSNGRYRDGVDEIELTFSEVSLEKRLIRSDLISSDVEFVEWFGGPPEFRKLDHE